MKVVAIQASPNKDGLTSRLAQAALSGARAKGAEVELINLCEWRILPCQACGTGWGHHKEPNELAADQCIHDDDFAILQQKVLGADGLVFCSPVYFHDISDPAKVFLDRLRRCDWPLGEHAKLKGKYLVAIAAAGGSGNGSLEAALQLEKCMLQFMGMKRVASFAVTRFNQCFQLQAAQRAGELLVDMTRADQG